jgi:general secretion pathway protein I
MTKSQHATNDDGFTLVEVLVAFIVLALALAGIYATLANSARLQADLALRDSAMAEAQSHLARLVAGPLTAGESNGRFASGVAWRAVVTPLANYGSAPGVTATPATITLTVLDGRNRVLTNFNTVALIQRAP